jgi:hypothetical protein
MEPDSSLSELKDQLSLPNDVWAEILAYADVISLSRLVILIHIILL